MLRRCLFVFSAWLFLYIYATCLAFDTSRSTWQSAGQGFRGDAFFLKKIDERMRYVAISAKRSRTRLVAVKEGTWPWDITAFISSLPSETERKAVSTWGQLGVAAIGALSDSTTDASESARASAVAFSRSAYRSVRISTDEVWFWNVALTSKSLLWSVLVNSSSSRSTLKA
jgi:hypothetical protein